MEIHGLYSKIFEVHIHIPQTMSFLNLFHNTLLVSIC